MRRPRFLTGIVPTLAAMCASLVLATPADATEHVFAGGFDGGLVGVGARVNGGLVEISPSPFETDAPSLEGLAASTDGRNLFAVDPSGALISMRIAHSGRLSVTGSPQPTGLFAYGVAATPNSKYVYASSQLPPGVFGFKVAPSGELSPIDQDPMPVDAPTGLAVSPSGKYLFVASETSPGAIQTFKIARSGTLTEIAGSPVDGADQAFSIVLAPNGKTLYAGARFMPSALAAYKVGRDGSLTELPDSPYATGGNNPFGLAVSPDGKQVYAALYDADKVAAFDVGAGGKLVAQAGSPYPALDKVSAVAVDPYGEYLYEQTAAPATPIRIAELTDGAPGAAAASSFVAQGDFQSVIPSAAQPPVARLKVKPTSNGRRVMLSAAESHDRTPIVEYRWNFGDGKRLVIDKDEVGHTYKKPGKYKVTVTETDESGCSTKFIFTGQWAYCNGSKQAQASIKVKVG